MKLLTSVRVILFLSLFSTILSAQSGLNTGNTNTAILRDFDGEALTIDSTAGGVGFTVSKINPTCTGCVSSQSRAQLAICTNTATGGEIRILANGTAPTTTVGLIVGAGSQFSVYGYNNIAAFKGIRTGSTSGSLYCVYSRLMGV